MVLSKCPEVLITPKLGVANTEVAPASRLEGLTSPTGTPHGAAPPNPQHALCLAPPGDLSLYLASHLLGCRPLCTTQNMLKLVCSLLSLC